MRAFLPLLTLTFLTGCATERVVEKPVPVPVPGPTQYVEVPTELVTTREKTSIPDSITYGQAIELWSRDRATIDIINGQLLGIKSLGDDDGQESD